MENAKDMDLRDMLDETARELREYESEVGTKQSFGYEVIFKTIESSDLYFHDQVRHFYKKLYFNPGLFGDQDTVVEEEGRNTNKMMEESVREMKQILNIK